MVRTHLLRVASLCLMIAWMLSGCLPSVVHTEHEYILLHGEQDRFVGVLDDEPLYEQFDREVLSDPYLYRLLMLFEHTTEAFLATNARARYPQAVANRPMIVLDSARPGVLRDLRADFKGTTTRVDLALGLGRDGMTDMAFARDHMAAVMVSAILELMGAESATEPPTGWPMAYEITAPDLAFERGLQIAFETTRVAHNSDLLRASKQSTDEAPKDGRLAWYEQVPANGYRFRFTEGQPLANLRSPDEALCTPGVVAAFFYRLMQRSSDYYPQRFMLWFVNYDADEIAEAKIVLVFRYLPSKPSMRAFVKSYIETYPADRERVLALANETFGAYDWLTP